MGGELIQFDAIFSKKERTEDPNRLLLRSPSNPPPPAALIRLFLLHLVKIK